MLHVRFPFFKISISGSFPVKFEYQKSEKNYYIKRCSFEFQWESCREMPWVLLTVLINNNICSSMTNSANKFWIRFGYFQLQKHLHLLYQRKCSYNSNIFFQSIPISICFGFRLNQFVKSKEWKKIVNAAFKTLKCNSV